MWRISIPNLAARLHHSLNKLAIRTNNTTSQTSLRYKRSQATLLVADVAPDSESAAIRWSECGINCAHVRFGARDRVSPNFGFEHHN